MDRLGSLFAAGIVAGAINAVAGGGSLITLPLLIFVGLPETVANATNRLGVLGNSLSSAAGYQQSGHLPGRRCGWSSSPRWSAPRSARGLPRASPTTPSGP